MLGPQCYAEIKVEFEVVVLPVTQGPRCECETLGFLPDQKSALFESALWNSVREGAK